MEEKLPPSQPSIILNDLVKLEGAEAHLHSTSLHPDEGKKNATIRVTKFKNPKGA